MQNKKGTDRSPLCRSREGKRTSVKLTSWAGILVKLTSRGPGTNPSTFGCDDRVLDGPASGERGSKGERGWAGTDRPPLCRSRAFVKLTSWGPGTNPSTFGRRRAGGRPFALVSAGSCHHSVLPDQRIPLLAFFLLYMGTSTIRNSADLGPYSRAMPRALWCS